MATLVELLTQASESLKHGNPCAAYSSAQDAMRCEGQTADSLNAIGAVLLNVGRLHEAKDALLQALRLRPIHLGARRNMRCVVEALDIVASAEDPARRLRDLLSRKFDNLPALVCLFNLTASVPQQDWATRHMVETLVLPNAQKPEVKDSSRLDELRALCEEDRPNVARVLELFEKLLHPRCGWDILEAAQDAVCKLKLDRGEQEVLSDDEKVLRAHASILIALLRRRKDNDSPKVELEHLPKMYGVAAALGRNTFLAKDTGDGPYLLTRVGGACVLKKYAWLWWFFEEMDTINLVKYKLGKGMESRVSNVPLPDGVRLIWDPKKHYGLQAMKPFEEGTLYLQYEGGLRRLQDCNLAYSAAVCCCGEVLLGGGRERMYVDASKELGPAALINHAGSEAPDFDGVAGACDGEANMVLGKSHDYEGRPKRKRPAGSKHKGKFYAERPVHEDSTLKGFRDSAQLTTKQFIELNPHLPMRWLGVASDKTAMEHLRGGGKIEDAQLELPLDPRHVPGKRKAKGRKRKRVEMQPLPKVTVPLPCPCGGGFGRPVVFAVNSKPLKPGDELLLDYFASAPAK